MINNKTFCELLEMVRKANSFKTPESVKDFVCDIVSIES